MAFKLDKKHFKRVDLIFYREWRIDVYKGKVFYSAEIYDENMNFVMRAGLKETQEEIVEKAKWRIDKILSGELIIDK